VGTLLRVAQRRTVEERNGESWGTTCVEELFCWGCSLAEVRALLVVLALLESDGVFRSTRSCARARCCTSRRMRGIPCSGR
jgi:hypothetical protein